MLFSNYKFRFSLLGTILGLIGIILFSSLGTWQVFRAIEKKDLQQNRELSVQQEAFLLDSNNENLESKKYAQVEAIGHYNKSSEILIDNIIHKSIAGYHVLTPFILKKDHSVIIVNRGWVPLGRDRSKIPELKTPQGEIKIRGALSTPRSKPPLILGELDTTSKVWLYFDKLTFEKKYAQTLLPLVILLDKNDPHGYVREWPKYKEKVAMHIGYAIQWYVFALIVLVTYLGVNFKRK